MPQHMLLQSLQQLPAENDSIPIMSPLAADMAVLERQIARLQWQQRQQQPQPPPQQQSYFAATIATDSSLPPTPYSIPQPPHLLPSSNATNFCGEQEMIGNDLSSGSAGVWGDLTHYPMLCDAVPGGGLVGGGAGAFSRAFSSPSVVGNVESKGRSSSPASQLGHASITKDSAAAAAAVAAPSTDRGRESSKKRKSAEKAGSHKPEEDDREKKMIKVENADTLVEPKLESRSIMSSPTAITSNTDNPKKNNCKDNNREASSSTSKENPRALEPPPKTDYIHVRARRGQATDSHSLAERVRREKISERMKLLQDLVPGCNKITGKAGMLDEIINYVQSLQRQVEFLSMKLAAVTPSLDFNLDALFAKEMSILAGGGGIPAQMGLPPELLGLSFLQFNPLQQQAMAAAAAAAVAECCSLPVPMVSSRSHVDAALHGIAAAPVLATEPCSFADSCNILVQQLPSTTSGWEGDLQRFYSSMEEFEQGKATVSVPADAAVAPSSTFQPLVNAR